MSNKHLVVRKQKELTKVLMFNRAFFLSKSKLFPNFVEFSGSEILFQVLLAVDDYHSSQKKKNEEGKYSTQSKETQFIHVPLRKQLKYNLEMFHLVIYDSNCNMRSICSQINLEHTRIGFIW